MRNHNTICQLLTFYNMVSTLNDQVLGNAESNVLLPCRTLHRAQQRTLVSSELRGSPQRHRYAQFLLHLLVCVLRTVRLRAADRRDVLCADSSTRQPCQQFTCCAVLAFANGNDRTRWNRIGTDQLAVFFVSIDDDLRMQYATMLLHDELDLALFACLFRVQLKSLLRDLVFRIARSIANNWNIVLLPFGDLHAAFTFAPSATRILVPSSTVKVCKDSIDFVDSNFL